LFDYYELLRIGLCLESPPVPSHRKVLKVVQVLMAKVAELPDFIGAEGVDLARRPVFQTSGDNMLDRVN
jgi:hypothetical protein